MSTATMEASAAAAVEEEAPTLAARVAAVCDLISQQRRESWWTSISARRVATISAMIDDIAATATEGRPRAGRRRRRMGSAGRYEEEGSLVEGGQAAVARARHRATGEDVAVKTLRRRRNSTHDVDGAGLLLREACFLAACQGHPSVVAFRGVARAPPPAPPPPGAVRGRAYSLVMDFVGPSLEDVLRARWRRDQPLPERDVRRIMRQLLAGAEAMHALGIAHRDIKPANILVGDGGAAVKLCDFGVAKSMAEHDPPYKIAGTLRYMAPELLVQNPDHDTQVDMWSLGCVMAELVDFVVILFDGEDDAEQLRDIFKVVGVPGKTAWKALKPQVLDDEVRQWRERQKQVGRYSSCDLRHTFPEEMLSEDGFEVLKGLLTCNPKRRLTAAAALRCRWFTANVDDGDAPFTASPAVAAVTEARSPVWMLPAAFAWKIAKSFAGRVLGLLRPKMLV
ncbi:hypothetical protein ACP4OV_020068 [Aristida adscensionis]